MKILLVQPPVTEKNITSYQYPPSGLIALAAYLRREGHDISLYDSNIENGTIEDILSWVRRETPQVLGLGAMSVNIGKAFKVAEAVKFYSSEIITVLGGIHPTIEPLEVLENPAVDFAVIGEGELTMTELLKELEAGKKDFEKILGLGFKKEGKSILNLPRPLVKNLDSLPIPAYDLLNLKKYRTPYTSRTPAIIMMRSRGCPFPCTFCGVKKMFGRGFRVQSPQRSLEEVDYLINKFGIKEIGFKDSEFTLDPKNVEDFCELLIKKNYDLTWTCNGRINHATYPLLKKMKSAGCIAISYGIESGDQEILNNLKKMITLEQVREAIKVTKEIGIEVSGNFMIGNPGDTKETIEKTINFAKELDLDYAAFAFTTPFPGTELREEALARGWILDKRLEAINYGDCMMNATNLPTAELKKYLGKAYRSFYLRPSYIAKRLLRLKKNDIANSIRGAFSIVKDFIKIKS